MAIDIAHLKALVSIRQPTIKDATAFVAAVRRNRTLHRSWVSPPATTAAYRRYLQRISADGHRGFLVTHKETGGLVGVINVSNIIRGTFQSAFLGYYAFSDYTGQGLMQEGLRLVLAHAFRKFGLHRLEANIQPRNAASVQLVRSCGFVREGYSRRYLKISGRWKDHERWAILAEDFNYAAS